MSEPTNGIRSLAALGQSVWYDHIEWTFVRGGMLARLIREDGLAGMTSNPAIFQKAIAGSSAYDDQIRELIAARTPPAAMLDALVGDDIRDACDAFRPVFEASAGLDGRVSIEVAPDLARYTVATIREGRRLHGLINRPNVMIKVPATAEGLPAVTALTADGIAVNITLIFSVDRYRQVMDAWLTGLEQRAASGGELNAIHSVASFFVSRIDTAADQRLAAGGATRAADRTALAGRVAIANSVRAWNAFREVAAGARFRALAARGANLQRVLWASTSVKDPALSPVHYVEALAGPDSVNTLPPETYTAARDAGTFARAIDRDSAGAESTLAALDRAGVNLHDLCAELEDAGVRSFTEAWERLKAGLAAKQEALVAR